MSSRLLSHLRANAVAYVALFFAIGGGGGAAIAATATSSNNIHACVSKKNGAVYIAKKCTKSTRALVFNKQGVRGATGAQGATGPAGTPAVMAYASVASNGVVGDEQGLTVTPASTGVYNVAVTASGCVDRAVMPVVSAYGNPAASGPESGTPTAWIGAGVGETFTVNAGEQQNGAFVPSDQGFTLLVECGQ